MVGLAIVFGVVIGVLLSLIGGGGSILTVPVLVYALGLDAHAATTTALVIVGVTALIGVVPHARAGRVAVRTALLLGSAGIAGAFAGATLNHLLPDTLILLLFGVLMLIVALRMLVTRQAGTRSEATTDARLLPTLLVGLSVGVLTGFFGVGGGFLIVPALVLVLKLPMRLAVGTSLLVIAMNSAAGFLAHVRFGGANTTIALLFIAGGLLGSLAGSRGVGRLGDRQLARGFAVFVALVGLYIIARNTGPILI